MLHAFATDDFLKAIDDFDRRARQGRAQVTGNSCRKGLGAHDQTGEGQFESLWWQRFQTLHGVNAPCTGRPFKVFKPKRG